MSQNQRPPKPSDPGPPSYYCRAETRDGTPCSNRAGFRTLHPGSGRCYLHGGISSEDDGRLSHGMHSELARSEFGERVSELLDQEAEPNQEMRYAAVLQRIVIEKYLASEVAGQHTLDEDTAETAVRLLDLFGRQKHRQVKVQERDAVPREEIELLLREVADAVRREVGELAAERIRRKIVEAETQVLEESD